MMDACRCVLFLSAVLGVIVLIGRLRRSDRNIARTCYRIAVFWFAMGDAFTLGAARLHQYRAEVDERNRISRPTPSADKEESQ